MRTSLVLVMVSAMMLAAPGSSVTGMKGREEAAAAEGVTADDGVMASSEDATYRKKHRDVHILHILFKLHGQSQPNITITRVIYTKLQVLYTS